MIKKSDLTFVHNFIDLHHKHLTEKSISGYDKPQKIHLQEVADLVWVSGGSDEEIVAAWLHDTVEDTDVTIEEIEKHFGPKVATMVNELSDTERWQDVPEADRPNWQKERKQRQAAKMKTKSDSVKRIKMADQISNIVATSRDRVVSLSEEEAENYIRGAYLVASACKGVSKLLDDLLEKEYKTVSK
jgi:(p)ppGpp synthase/HD superfamily hydrolase